MIETGASIHVLSGVGTHFTSAGRGLLQGSTCTAAVHLYMCYLEWESTSLLQGVGKHFSRRPLPFFLEWFADCRFIGVKSTEVAR